MGRGPGGVRCAGGLYDGFAHADHDAIPAQPAEAGNVARGHAPFSLHGKIVLAVDGECVPFFQLDVGVAERGVGFKNKVNVCAHEGGQ